MACKHEFDAQSFCRKCGIGCEHASFSHDLPAVTRRALPVSSKYQIHDREYNARAATSNILQLLGLESMVQEVMLRVSTHKFRCRHSMHDKILLIVLHISRTNGTPVLVCDLHKLFSRSRTCFLKSMMNEFGCHRPSHMYSRNIFDRFVVHFRSLGAKVDIDTAYASFLQLALEHPSTPVEIVVAVAILGDQQSIYDRSFLQQHFPCQALELFAKKAVQTAVKASAAKGAKVSLTTVFKEIKTLYKR